MVRGIRAGSTVINPAVQPQAQYLYDPITRRAVRYVETVVPTLHPSPSDYTESLAPADTFYALVGAFSSSPPRWYATTFTGSAQNWDTTDLRYYARLSAGNSHASGAGYFFRSGYQGLSTTHAPKNFSDVTTFCWAFRARFPDGNAASTGSIGLVNSANYIKIYPTLSPATTWTMATKDGTTEELATGGTADTSFHDWRIEWDSTQVRAYLDETLLLTNDTNLPIKPLPVSLSGDASGRVDIVDMRMWWK